MPGPKSSKWLLYGVQPNLKFFRLSKKSVLMNLTQQKDSALLNVNLYSM